MTRKIYRLSKVDKQFSGQLTKLKNSSTVLFLSIIFAFASGLQVTTWSIDWIEGQYNSHIGWKKYEEKVINKLGVSVDDSYTNALIGSPVYSRINDIGMTENIYARRGYWVQTVVGADGETKLIAITVCNPEFKPTFKTSSDLSIQFNVTKMSSVGDNHSYTPHYQVSGATGPKNLIDQHYFGNPGYYLTYYAGVTDTCGGGASKYYDLVNSFNGKNDTEIKRSGDIKKMREEVVITTFAIANLSPSKDLDNFWSLIGPDHRLVRVLPMYDEVISATY